MDQSSLAEKLAKLVNPAPVFDASDEEINSESVAHLVENCEELNVCENNQSKLRIQTASLLSGDKRYAGRRISRKIIQDVPEQQIIKSDEDSEEESFQQNDQPRFQKKQVSFNSEVNDDDSDNDTDNDTDESSNGDEDEDVSGLDENEESNIDDEDEDNSEGKKLIQDDSGIKSFSKMDVELELEQAKGTQSLLLLWEFLLESRITLQKSLQIINQIPQFDIWNVFMTDGDKEFKKNYNDGEKSVEILLNKLLSIQTLLLNKNNKISNTSVPHTKNESGDEITSESDNSETEEQMETEGCKKITLKRKYQFEEYPDLISKRHKAFEIYRNDTIKKWSDRTRLSSGKLKNSSFAAFEQSALKQIEQILNDKPRLIRRTKLRRTNYRILGTVDNKEKIEEMESEENYQTNQEDYNMEIFDDDDFYHMLLREFIEKQTVDVNDPVALGRQWLEIQKLRSKMKRKVDTKASKGRRLRFDAHPKLINFMAPIEQCGMTESSKNELFSSLFGKKTIHSNT